LSALQQEEVRFVTLLTKILQIHFKNGFNGLLKWYFIILLQNVKSWGFIYGECKLKVPWLHFQCVLSLWRQSNWVPPNTSQYTAYILTIYLNHFYAVFSIDKHSKNKQIVKTKSKDKIVKNRSPTKSPWRKRRKEEKSISISQHYLLMAGCWD